MSQQSFDCSSLSHDATESELVENLKFTPDIFEQPVSVLMTANGSLDRTINLEMLCTTISTNVCRRAGIIKFIGFNKIYFYDPAYTFHSEENKYFFNQCSFEFKNKVVVKLFSNGSYIVTGCRDEEEAKNNVNLMLTIINAKKYVYLTGEDAERNSINRLALVYHVQGCVSRVFRVSLANYSVKLNGYEFNKYKVSNIVNLLKDDETNIIESVTDIFKYSSVSIKLRNINGNIDVYKNKVIISVQNRDHYQPLLDFFDKYKYKLISLPTTNSMSKMIFLNTALLHRQHNRVKQLECSDDIDSIRQMDLSKKVIASSSAIVKQLQSKH